MEKSDSVPFAATLDRSRDYRPKWKKSDKKDKYHIIYMWNLKHDTNEHIYETKKKKTDTENRLVVVKGEEGSSGLGF